MYYFGTVKIRVQDLEGKEVTGREMYQASKDFAGDLGPYSAWPFAAWFDFVRLMPYESDESRFPWRVVELVPRPAYLLDRSLFPEVDCKKKAILLGAWAHANHKPFRFLAVSSREDKQIHHVFPQIDFGDGWVTVDATFPEFRIGQAHPITYAAELRP